MATQSYPDVEHIVVDGGSTDGTPEVLQRSSAQWLSEPDHGMYDAINKGIRLASGDILGYLNADDAYVPWAVESAVDVFIARPDVDLVFGDGVSVYEATGRQELRLFGDIGAQELAMHGSLFQPTVFWRRGLSERVGEFNSKLRFVGDLDFWLRCLAGGRGVHVREILAVERLHDLSLSSSHRDAMAMEDAAMRARHQERFEVRDRDAALRRARWRYKLGQRRRWIRFLGAWRAGDRNLTDWPCFRREGRLRVDTLRLAAGQLPRSGSRWLADAVRSELAARLLKVDGGS